MNTTCSLLALVTFVYAPLAATTAQAAVPTSTQSPAPGSPGTAPAAPARHPLKGVIVDIRADRGALLVKHEAIPGVMHAMTMLLKVDEATLKSAKKEQAITGLLVRKPDGWWLEEVKPAP